MTTKRCCDAGRDSTFRRAGRFLAVLLLLVGSAGAVERLGAQELADYDYENLGFRGVGFEVGHLFPNNVDETYSLGGRLDLGYLGPGLRIVPSFTYWSSNLRRAEVQDLEERLEELIVRSGGTLPEGGLDPLGPITWTDLVLGVDGHFVWSIPLGFLGYAGAGGAAHLLDGRGADIEGTFIEDLLDSVRAGFNLHVGLERALHPHLRFYSTARYELLGDLRYGEVRLGAQLFFGDPAEGEAGS